MIKISCAGLTENQIESELFGHEKGAIPHTTSLSNGVFELADRATILLDEIGGLPLPIQTKLLRVIENKAFFRKGGKEILTSDVRLIVTTNMNLKKKVGEGTFRRDLFYRINI